MHPIQPYLENLWSSRAKRQAKDSFQVVGTEHCRSTPRERVRRLAWGSGKYGTIVIYWAVYVNGGGPWLPIDENGDSLADI